MQVISAESLLQDDLARSGLKAADIEAFPAQEAELAAVGVRPHLYIGNPGVSTPGYVIPYYDINGSRAPFYRIKLFNPTPKGARYLQPANTSTWIYYPKLFKTRLIELLAGRSRTITNGFPPAIIVTEGEKKAVKACIEGFPTCAVGGIYAWRTRTLVLPEGTSLVKNRNNEIVARLEQHSPAPITGDGKAYLAAGLNPLIKLASEHKLQIVIVFDSDNPPNPDVKAAMAELAFEMRIQGIPTSNIRALQLPTIEDQKMGLDDFLLQFGAEAFDKLLHKTLASKNAFPIHPNLKQLLNARMAGGLERNEAKHLSLMILSEMDHHGIRMIEQGTGIPYFFDSRGKILMRVNLLQHHTEPLHETRFGHYLYRNFDVAQADMRLIQWLAAEFTGEEPVESVQPRSVQALLPGNRLAHQLDDGHFVIVGGDQKQPIRICENGTEGLLFRSDQVEPIDGKELIKKFREQVEWIHTKPAFEEFYWPKALSQFHFSRPSDAKVLACLSYISPWLFRWNGAQLPVELMIGEPGSGKSSMYSLRLQILNGRPALRNQPTDVRDWYASITSQDGLHVIDNVHMVNKELRQRLSDEICRVVTEPTPYIEMRKLFTTTDNYRLPVRVVFAMTAIQQPFMNADILQRSLVMELQAIGSNHNSDWASGALEAFGGRTAWLAHHLAVLHCFFRKVDQGGWNPNYKSGHRLAHFEQLFRTIGALIGVPDGDLLGDTLAATAESQVSEYDWTMEALKQFAYEVLPALRKDPRKGFTLQDVASWAMSRDEYRENTIICSARRLARYIKSHKFMVEKVAGFVDHERYANRDTYRIKLP